jgi:GNAT superfamily N-acetyltransferase
MNTFYKLRDYNPTMVFEREHPRQLRWDDKYKLWMLQDNDKCQGIWLRDKEKLVAEIILTWESDNVIHADSITVLPEYRRQGLGTKLVSLSLQWAENMGFNTFLGEARMGSSWEMFKNIGASAICMHKNWQGTGEEYMFFKMDI